jgi:hypothetical protein
MNAGRFRSIFGGKIANSALSARLHPFFGGFWPAKAGFDDLSAGNAANPDMLQKFCNLSVVIAIWLFPLAVARSGYGRAGIDDQRGRRLRSNPRRTRRKLVD